MDQTIRALLNDLYYPDSIKSSSALQNILSITEQPVIWAVEVWKELQSMLLSYDGQERATTIQVICSLAKNIPEQTLDDFDKLMAVTRDVKFETARKAIQSLWKVAIVDSTLKKKVLTELNQLFKECINEKDYALKRYDIIECFRKIYNATNDDTIRTKYIFTLIHTEKIKANRKKYNSLWKDLFNLKKGQLPSQ
jgi:hypothetical protein